MSSSEVLRAAQATKAHMKSMNPSDTPTARYTLDIQASATSATSFTWAIRDRGKLIQRSDRLLRSAADARKRGEEELERILHPRDRQ
jgi:hypothetical protein